MEGGIEPWSRPVEERPSDLPTPITQGEKFESRSMGPTDEKYFRWIGPSARRVSSTMSEVDAALSRRCPATLARHARDSTGVAL